MNISLTPRQQVEAAQAPFSLEQRIALYEQQIAYLEALDPEKAPTLTIDQDPDGTGEPVELTLVGPAYLSEFTALTIRHLRRMIAETAA